MYFFSALISRNIPLPENSVITMEPGIYSKCLVMNDNNLLDVLRNYLYFTFHL